MTRRRKGGGRVTPKKARPCMPRSAHAGRRVPCLRTSVYRVGGQTFERCCWCGSTERGLPNVAPQSSPADPADEVPAEWFAPADDRTALPVDQWRQLRDRVAATQEAP